MYRLIADIQAINVNKCEYYLELSAAETESILSSILYYLQQS